MTEEIKSFEEKIMVSEEALLQAEQEVFAHLAEELLSQVSILQQVVERLAYLDCVQALAQLALECNYCRPQITGDSCLNIQEGRHPVVEQIQADEYIPNDTQLDSVDHSFMLLTGPNMAGKSTYIRQVALITLMAQMGSYVPATAATIGITDQIFTRVGASDNLSEGQSTFMVEMVEVSNILHNATERSLIILDEIGRGTSTYDGMSIARAITEYIHDTVGARTLFATHYHELLDLETQYQGIRNYRVVIEEMNGDLTFLRKIEPGGIDKSYGISIAGLAGFPQSVLQRAYESLRQYEKKAHKQASLWDSMHAQPTPIQDVQEPKSDIADSIKQKIQAMDPEHMTPVEALIFLAELKQDIQS